MFAEVQTIERLSPTMIRVAFAGGDLDQFEPAAETDSYINARFLPEHSPIAVPFGPEDLEDVDRVHHPRPRRYTVRDWDPVREVLTIDFVAHGDHGYAGPWAQRAKPGDRLQFVGPRGNYRPSESVDWHLFVGDESALPAIASSLEALPSGHAALVFAVVDGPDHEYPLPGSEGVQLTWLYRDGVLGPETLLADAVAAAEFLPGTYDAFVHGEAGEVRAVRRHLLDVRGVDVGAESISAYWRRAHTDEAWRAIKRGFMTE